MRKLARYVTPVLLALTVAACHGDDSQPSQAVLTDNDYRLKHPIVVEPANAVLQLANAGDKITDDDRRRLHAFAGAFIRRGRGPVEVSVGARGIDDDEARAYGQDIAQGLLDEGLKRGELRLQMVLGDPAVLPGAARLRFSTAVVNLPPCRDWSDTTANAPYADFGCTVQRNLGAMVTDPRDLERASDGGPGHAVRDDLAIDKMDRGEATWSVPLPLSATPQSGGQ